MDRNLVGSSDVLTGQIREFNHDLNELVLEDLHEHSDYVDVDYLFPYALGVLRNERDFGRKLTVKEINRLIDLVDGKA